MAERAFRAPYKKVKDVTVHVYDDTLSGMPAGFEKRLPVYMDPRDDTSLVIAIPTYVASFLGKWASAGWRGDRTIELEVEPREGGAVFIRSYKGLEALKDDFKTVMELYRDKVAAAVEEKVIVIKAAYSARDENGRRVDCLPAFSDAYAGALVGFNYGIYWRINGELYSRDARDKEYPDRGRLWKCGHGDSLARDGKPIPWSAEAEAACKAFYDGVRGIGQRMHDFLSQDEQALKLQLETGRGFLLEKSNH